MRLTKKKKHYDSTDIDEEYKLEEDVSVGEAVDKLGQLEDVEEELGIDLVTLFKALKNGFYYKDYEEKGYYDKPDILFVEPRSIELKGNFGFKKIMFDYCGVCIKDYGKTWALTKEELEKC